MRAIPALFLLAACSSQPDAPAGLTADDQRQLNEAAEMLDANAISADAVATDAVATNESPAP